MRIILILIFGALISNVANALTYKYESGNHYGGNSSTECDELTYVLFDTAAAAAEAAAVACYDGNRMPYNSVFTYESVSFSHQLNPDLAAWFINGTAARTSSTDGSVVINPHFYQIEVIRRLVADEKNTIKISTVTANSYGNYLTALEPDGITRSKVPQNLINKVNLVAEVKDQDGNRVNAAIKLKVTALEGSGGHVQANHTDRNPPKAGKLKAGVLNSHTINIPKSAMVDGLVQFEFAASDVSGDHKIEVTCTDITCEQIGKDSVWVGVQDLKTLPGSGNYALIGSSCHHQGNHYATDRVIEKVQGIAQAYNDWYPNAPVMHINDISLERGGLFDAKSQDDCSPLVKANWGASHNLHRTGEDVDVRANNDATAIPTANYADFQFFAQANGCYAGIHKGGTSAQHFHLYCTQKQGK